jgi:hypothetical protein
MKGNQQGAGVGLEGVLERLHQPGCIRALSLRKFRAAAGILIQTILATHHVHRHGVQAAQLPLDVLWEISLAPQRECAATAA